MPPQPRRRATAKKAAKKAAGKAVAKKAAGKAAARKPRVPRALRFVADPHDLHAVVDHLGGLVATPGRTASFGDLTPAAGQIGRASCRERVLLGV